jgi:hypothetical protein
MLKSVTPETKNTVKNIFLGILTSVLGATAIYFLGFNNKKPRFTVLERGEITADAWKTYVTVENIYIQSRVSMIRDALQFKEFGDIAKESAAESKKIQNSLEDVIATDGVDKDLVTFLDKRLKTEYTQSEETEKFYKELALRKEEWTKFPFTDSLKARLTWFLEQTKTRFTKAAPNIEALSKKLFEAYEQPFNINELLVIQATKYKKDIFNLTIAEEKKDTDLPPDQSVSGGKDAGDITNSSDASKITKQYLTGKWDAGGGITITLKANGKLSWSIPSDNKEAKGSWLLKNNQLVMNIDRHPVTGKNANWIFNISNAKKNSFTIILDAASAKIYNLVRN